VVKVEDKLDQWLSDQFGSLIEMRHIIGRLALVTKGKDLKIAAIASGDKKKCLSLTVSNGPSLEKESMPTVIQVERCTAFQAESPESNSTHGIHGTNS